MRKRRAAWTPDIYDMAERRAAALAEPDIYDLAQPATGLDLEVEATDPLAGHSLVDAEPLPITAQADARPAPRPPPRGDNSGFFGLMAGALLGAGLTLLAAPTSGERLRSQLRAVGARRTEPESQATGTVAQIMPNITSTEPEAPGAEQRNGG